MSDVSATEAARNFADLLDAVERGEEFTILRRGRPVAHLQPVSAARGAALKDALRRHPLDTGWRDELIEARAQLTVEERR